MNQRLLLTILKYVLLNQKQLKKKLIEQEKFLDLLHSELAYYSLQLQIFLQLMKCTSILFNGFQDYLHHLQTIQQNRPTIKLELKFLMITSLYHYMRMYVDLYLKLTNCYFLLFLQLKYCLEQISQIHLNGDSFQPVLQDKLKQLRTQLIGQVIQSGQKCISNFME